MTDSEDDLVSTQYPAAVSDIGCEREINEDRYACFSFGESSVWLVCDGMGGAVGGELAAQLAIDTIKKVLEADPANISHKLLGAAFNEANRVIVLRRQNPAFSGMGTTIVGAVITPNYISIFHAGDSRAYLFSKNGLEQITVDHTYVQDLVAKGMISQAEALHHPQSHVLTRCLGGQLKLDFDETQHPIIQGGDEECDVLLLCSDGLYSLVTDDEIHSHLVSFKPQLACSKLVELARNRGGFDNITVAIVPLPGRVDLEGEVEIPEVPISSPKEARVLNRNYSTPKREFTLKQKMILISILALASMLAVILGLLFI